MDASADVLPDVPGDAADPGPSPDDGVVGDPGPQPDVPIKPGEAAWDLVRLGTSETINDAWGPGDGTFSAAGDHGALLWYNGHTWTPLPHLTDADLYGVGGLPSGDVYVVGAGGTLLRRDNAGWNVLDPGVEVDLYGVFAVSSTQVHIVGDGGTILRFDGAAFKEDISNTTLDLRTVFVPPGGTPFAGGAGGQVYKFSGGQWIATQATGSSTVIADLWGTSNQFMVAVGSGGTILVSTGAGWSDQTSNDIKERDLYGVWGTSTEEVYCVGDGGVVIHYNGSKWTVVETDGPLYTTRPFRGVWGATAGDEKSAFAVGEGGAILGFDGESWVDTPSGPDLALNDVLALDEAHFVAAGAAGLLMRWRPPKGWSGVRAGTAADLTGVHPLGDDVLVVGQDGVALLLSDLDRITAVDAGTTKDLHAVHGNASGLVLAVGAAGVAVRATAGAEPEFTPENTGSIAHIRGVWVADDGSAIGVGDQGTVLERAASGGWSTEVAPTSTNLHAVTVVGAVSYAVGDNGVVLRREGGSWSKESEAPGEFLYGVWGAGDDVFAVGWTGLVLSRSVDGDWIAEESGTNNVLEAIDGVGSTIWIAGRKGTLLRRR